MVINEESFRVTKKNLHGFVFGVASLEGNLTVAAIDDKDEHAASNGIPLEGPVLPTFSWMALGWSRSDWKSE